MACVIFLLLLMATACSAQQYQTDQPQTTAMLNRLWSFQGQAKPLGTLQPHWTAVYNPADWFEWNSLKAAWTSNGDEATQRSFLENAKIDGVNAAGTQARGYIWPANNSELWIGEQYHFDQMPRLICAVYNDYIWSRDRAFLRQMRPKMEVVMGYMMDAMRGQDGLPQCPGIYDGRSGHGPNTTYMDCYREGGTVAWIDEDFYTALRDMTAMEQVLGRPAEAAAYAAAARLFPARFDAGLWNPATSRYAGWRDRGGALHDDGFTYLNLEALVRGLGDTEKAYAIFHWLDNGHAQPTLAGSHVGSTNIYQCVVAPRSNTRAIAPQDWDSWSVPPVLRRTTMAYGGLVEDGGALVWVNYYDVIARLKWLDADSAWGKFDAMLRRIEGDPLRFDEDVTHPTNAYGENYLEVGPADGSENGIVGVTPLSGFMGVHAEVGGLFATPNLPTSLLFLGCDGIRYGGANCSIRVSRGEIIASATSAQPAAPFKAERPFDLVQIWPTGPGLGTLQKHQGLDWVDRARAVIYGGVTPQAIPLPEQKPGTYRIVFQTAALLPTGGAGRIKDCRAVQETLSPVGGGIVRGRNIAFAASGAFSRIVLRTLQNLGGVVLQRRIGHHWRMVALSLSSAVGGGILTFADQSPGDYRLALSRSTHGTLTLQAINYAVTVTNGRAWATSVQAGQTVKLHLPTFSGAALGQ